MARSPGDTTSFKLVDTGLKFSDEGEYEWDNVSMAYDKGYLWDQRFGPLANEDTTNYDYLKPVEFA
jgi:hypothetical protein